MEELFILGEEEKFNVIARALSYTPYRNGRVGHPDNWEPDEQEEIELAFTLSTGGEYEPTEEEYDYMYKAMLSNIRG